MLKIIVIPIFVVAFKIWHQIPPLKMQNDLAQKVMAIVNKLIFILNIHQLKEDNELASHSQQQPRQIQRIYQTEEVKLVL